LIGHIRQAVSDGSCIEPACEEADISLRTYRRWIKGDNVIADKRPDAIRAEPVNKLSEEERDANIEVVNQPEYASLPPSQIVPKLADKGVYMASESSFYRVLHERSQVQHRGKTQQHKKHPAPSSFTATGPNQVWSWDITYCSSRVRGQYYYLYLIEDIFSRKIVGWEVYTEESGELAADLLQRTVLREQCFKKPLVLHSDNGAPMRSVTLKTKMEELGISGSHSRPRVSNDNPFSEALFKTLKTCPTWPNDGFENLEATREWVNIFSIWYNEKHCHSGIRFVTPSQRHKGEDKQILEQRNDVYKTARENNPSRWSGDTRNWSWIDSVNLNPDKTEIVEKKAA
jgi:putative transposase